MLSLNHIGLVVSDFEACAEFYTNVVGLERHQEVKSWFKIDEKTSIHLIAIPETKEETSISREVQHVALLIDDLVAMTDRLFDGGHDPFQMDFNGNTSNIDSKGSDLAFGLGSTFVYDPSGNLVEFIQYGRGAIGETIARDLAGC